MAGRGRPLGSPNVRNEKPFGIALRMELRAAGDGHRELRLIARNLLTLAKVPDATGLAAIREVVDRLDGKPKQEAEVTLRQAVARDLTDDDLAAIAARAEDEGSEPSSGPKPDSSKLN
jgi:hypothetical protein